MKIVFTLLLTLCLYLSNFSQSCSSLNLQHVADVSGTCGEMFVSVLPDQLGRKYVYVANKEAGLSIYDMGTPATPNWVATVPISQFDSLHVMNLCQSGNYIYLALGNHFNSGQNSGLAIVNVSNPVIPVLSDYWVLNGSSGGAGIVKVEGNFAYLGAMENGLIVLEISNPATIQMLSQFMPDINYPVNNPTASLYNARGLEVKNQIVYLCFDAGGLRIINCTNPVAPVENGRYANPALYQPLNLPRAYNNIVVNDSLAYIAVDYCGMEILNISDSQNISLVGWWNPYNCPNNNWFTSPVHANEILLNENCAQIYLSTGKSDMVVVDVSDPSQPDSCNFYGGVSNNIGTWGIGLNSQHLFLTYICTLGIPFASNWTGLKLLSYTDCMTGFSDLDKPRSLRVFPNPVSDYLFVEGENLSSEVQVLNMLGARFLLPFESETAFLKLNVSTLSEGIYFLESKGASAKIQILR